MIVLLPLLGCTGPDETPGTSCGYAAFTPGACGPDATGDTGCPAGFSCAGGACQGTTCAECLPPVARIATPDGPRAIVDLRRGDLVWTRDPAGRRVAAPIVELRSQLAAPDHQVVELVLADGRRVRGSAPHPTADGRTLGALAPGDPLDGSVVASVVRVDYTFARTFDLLPAGPTGAYEADGVWLGSTLAPVADSALRGR